MDIDFIKLADLGFPTFITILVAIGITKGLWPWWRNEYWVSREKRWQQQFESSNVKERLMMDQAAAFLKAIEAYQDGFAAANAEQHQAGLDLMRALQEEIKDYHRTSVSLIELLVTRLGGDDK